MSAFEPVVAWAEFWKTMHEHIARENNNFETLKKAIAIRAAKRKEEIK